MRQPFDEDDDEDFCSENGALRLASMLRSYWVQRGYKGIRTAVTRVRAGKGHERKHTYRVLSNIGHDGFPPKDSKTEG